ncbi:MAG: hypothetical protein K1000chlam4_00158 [Chlamydiae bacterium]|nr:hypothetical protein [Chlamydiota bacterium]
MKNQKKHLEAIDTDHHLVDKHQNYWQLASIQSVAFGFPILLVGRQLSNLYGPGTALSSICIGNLILWIIGLATVTMAYSKRKNAIQNFIEYVGKLGSILGGLVLLLAFLFWYSLQLRGTVTEMKNVLQQYVTLQNSFDIRIGAALGLIIALLSLGGIRLIKWTAVVAFPFLFLFVLYAIIMKGPLPVFKGTWGVSSHAIGFSIAITLPGIINLPTFFRHSRSRVDAFFALTLLIIFTVFIESSSILLGSGVSSESGIFAFLGFDIINLVLVTIFIIVSIVCVNLVNIYFASAAWESMLPRIGGAMEYAIMGVGGTIAFIFFKIREPMFLLEDVLDSFIASLGIVLLMAYLVKRIVNHRERNFEKVISGICWIIGCLTAVYIQTHTSLQSSYAFFGGIGASALAFLIFIFIEETLWSIKTCIKEAHVSNNK